VREEKQKHRYSLKLLEKSRNSRNRAHFPQPSPLGPRNPSKVSKQGISKSKSMKSQRLRPVPQSSQPSLKERTPGPAGGKRSTLRRSTHIRERVDRAANVDKRDS